MLHSCDMKKNEIVEPKAKKIEKVLKMHEHERKEICMHRRDCQK